MKIITLKITASLSVSLAFSLSLYHFVGQLTSVSGHITIVSYQNFITNLTFFLSYLLIDASLSPGTLELLSRRTSYENSSLSLSVLLPTLWM